MKTRVEIDSQDMIILWKFLGELYGASFTSQYGQHVKTWRAHFKRKGFTPRHLELGMEKCRALCETHAPNLSTFSARCTPSLDDYGLPDEDSAYLMAVRREWKHAIVWHAVAKIGAFEFRTWPESRTRNAFIKHYKKLFQLHVAGERFVIPVSNEKALPEPMPTKDEQQKSYAFLKTYLNREPAYKPGK